MNQLSWLIYLAEVSEKLSDVFIGLAVILGIGAGAYAFLGSLFASDQDQPMRPYVQGGIKIACAAALCSLVAVLIPSSKTVYMIAASEAGETIVTSPEAKEMLSDLRGLIRRKLKEEVSL